MISASYRPDIDGLRAVAVVPVVLYHADVALFGGGFVGVDVFFVISGYLITRLLLADLDTGRFSLIHFYERRARRILPALFFVMAATVLIGAVFFGPSRFEDFAESILPTLVFGSNIYFWIDAGDYFGPGPVFEPLLHTWSLAVEEQFYLVFPLLLLFMHRRLRRALAWIVAALVLLSFAGAVLAVPTAPEAAFYLLPMRFWELGVGAFLALVPVRASPAPLWRETLAVLGLVAILASVFLYDHATPFPGVAALLPCLGAAALIRAGESGPTLVGRALSLPSVVFVGLISYSLYLWHWPLLSAMRITLSDKTLPQTWVLAAVAASFVLSVLSWRFVERPFRLRPPVGPSRRTVFRASAAATLGTAAVALLIIGTEGLPQRLPADVRQAYGDVAGELPFRDLCFKRLPVEGLCRFDATMQQVEIEEDDAPEPTEIVLWGDSHALSAFAGVAYAAAEYGLDTLLAATPGCAPLLGVPHRRKNCGVFNESVLKEIAGRDDVRIVILHARWSREASRVRVLEEKVPAEDSVPVMSAGREIPERIDAGLRATVDALLSTGREVVLLGGVPEFAREVPYILALERRFGIRSRLPDIETMKLRNREVDALFQELAELPGVHYIPLIPEFCQPECVMAREGHPLYYDEDHLNQAGSKMLIGPVVARLLEERPLSVQEDPYRMPGQ